MTSIILSPQPLANHIGRWDECPIKPGRGKCAWYFDSGCQGSYLQQQGIFQPSLVGVRRYLLPASQKGPFLRRPRRLLVSRHKEALQAKLPRGLANWRKHSRYHLFPIHLLVGPQPHPLALQVSLAPILWLNSPLSVTTTLDTQ